MSAFPKRFSLVPAAGEEDQNPIATLAPSPLTEAGPAPLASPTDPALPSEWRQYPEPVSGEAGSWIGLNSREEIAQAETVWCSVGSLAEELGETAVAELVDDFTVQTPQLLARIQQMAGVEDSQPALRRAAHSLKGSSSIFGLAGIERASFQLERTALDRSLRAQPPLVLELTRQFSRTIPILRAVRHRLLANGN